MKLFLPIYYIGQWTWGLLQNIVGLWLFLFIKKTEIRRYYGAVQILYSAQSKVISFDSFAVGMFIFMPANTSSKIHDRVLAHEYGHTVQSLIFGPLYFPLIGVPSAIWALKYERSRVKYNSQDIYYGSRYPEKQANKWGQRISGQTGIDW